MARRTIIVDEVTPVVRGYPSAVVANGLVFASGVRGGQPNQVPRFADLPSKVGARGTGFLLSDAMEGEVAADSWAAHDNLEKVLAAAGTDGTQILRQHIWQRDKRFFPIYEGIRMEWQKVPAPSSGLGVSDVVGRFSRWIGVDALAVVPGANPSFPERATVRTFDNQELPSASFYSQAVRCGPLVFLAGHIPIQTDKPGKPVVRGFDDVPESGRFLETGRSHPDSRQGPIAAQSWYCYEHIRNTLASQGLTMADVLHVSVFLQDMRDFGTFHRVHQHFFPLTGPALVVTQFDEVGHKGTLIEIEPTAIQPGQGLATAHVAWPIPAPFSGPAATKSGPLWFLAGMLGLNGRGQLVSSADHLEDPVGVRVVEDLSRFEKNRGFAAQCWQAWRLMERVCSDAGLSLSNIVKTTIYLRSFEEAWIYEEIREAFIQQRALPAVEFVAVSGPGPVPNSHVQIEAIATEDV